MPDDTIGPPIDWTADWVNHWVDQNLPPDRADSVAWRYAVGCTEILARDRLVPVVEMFLLAALDHKLTPLDSLLLGNM